MRIFALTMLLSIVLIGGCQSTQTIESNRDSASLEPNTATMWVHGMGCPQCAYNVDLQLLKVPGVEDVKVDMSSGKVTAKLSPDNPPTREQLARAIDQTGFTLKKIEMR